MSRLPVLIRDFPNSGYLTLATLYRAGAAMRDGRKDAGKNGSSIPQRQGLAEGSGLAKAFVRKRSIRSFGVMGLRPRPSALVFSAPAFSF